MACAGLALRSQALEMERGILNLLLKKGVEVLQGQTGASRVWGVTVSDAELASPKERGVASARRRRCAAGRARGGRCRDGAGSCAS